MGQIKKTAFSPFITFAGKGINEHSDPIMIENNEFASMTNVHIDKERLYKRPGRTPWGVAFASAFKGATDYVDSTGAARLIVASGGQLAHAETDDNTDLQAVTDEEVHFHTQKSKLFINGATTQKKIVGVTPNDVGIAAPLTAPTAAAGAATGLTGSYAWVCTYVTSDGLESDPSDVSNSVVLANEKATVTPPASPDSRVTSRNLWRTVAGGEKYFYDGAIANNTLGATFTSSQSDAALGDLVESNHGQPSQADIAASCNERQFWAIGNKVYPSEIGSDEAFLEYSELEFSTLPNSGSCTGLKSLYNPASGREDLYCFQVDSISYLPQGDPGNPIQSIRRDVGCIQHDTIREYNGMLVFMTNKKSVGVISGGRYYDISSLNIPVSIGEIVNPQYCRAGIIFDNYYALTARNTTTKLYNNVVFVCDMRSINVVNDLTAIAKAAWVKWNINAEYILQRADGTVLTFDNSDFVIYSLSLSSSQDTGTDTVKTDIYWSVRTKNFAGDSVMWLKQPRVVGIKGRYSKEITVTPYYWSDRRGGSSNTFTGGDLFIMGTSVMGDNISSDAKLSEATLKPGAANTFSFNFGSESKDSVFELTGFQFTYKQFARGI